MKKLKDNEKGIALMAVLWVLVILIALATEFAFSMKMEVNTTRNHKEDMESYYLSKAGFNLALAELFPKASFHSIHEEHGLIIGNEKPAETGTVASYSEMEGEFGQEKEIGQNFDIVNRNTIELESGTVTYKIIDENGKISINSADKDTLIKLLEYSGVEEKIERSTISDSILDWIDTDKNHRLNGAEDDYYQRQTPPYYSKNGRIETMDELLKIRGMTKEILYGSQDSPEAEDKKYRGIANYLTVYKIPTINPNTASKEVLRILFPPGQVTEILENKAKKGYHSNTLSSVFRIISTGKIANSPTEHTIEAVVEKIFIEEQPKIVIHFWNDNVLSL